jgi:hypothetical protein
MIIYSTRRIGAACRHTFRLCLIALLLVTAQPEPAQAETIIRTTHTPRLNMAPELIGYITESLRTQPWLNGNRLVSVHVTDDWSYRHNEYTGLADSRTIIAEAVLDTGHADCYEVIPCLFMQTVSFFGLKKGPLVFQFRLHEHSYFLRKPAE